MPEFDCVVGVVGGVLVGAFVLVSKDCGGCLCEMIVGAHCSKSLCAATVCHDCAFSVPPCLGCECVSAAGFLCRFCSRMFGLLVFRDDTQTTTTTWHERGTTPKRLRLRPTTCSATPIVQAMPQVWWVLPPEPDSVDSLREAARSIADAPPRAGFTATEDAVLNRVLTCEEAKVRMKRGNARVGKYDWKEVKRRFLRWGALLQLQPVGSANPAAEVFSRSEEQLRQRRRWNPNM